MALGACNVEPVTHDHCDVKLARAPGCAAAALVVMSDYVSTQIALNALDGTTLCGSFISSSRSGTTSVSFALSGDVTLPSSRPESGRAVVLDSYGTNVVSFLEPESGKLTAQLAVGTGFEANLQDYLEIDATRALVSRWDENPTPGREPFDGGGDLLLIDTRAPAILERIALPRDDDWPPHPAGLTRIGDEAVVTLQRFSQDIRSQADAQLVGITLDTPSVSWTLNVAGLKNCGPLVPSPDGSIAVLACTGYVDRSGAGVDLAESGLVVFDLATSPPSELTRFAASDIAGDALQAGVAFFAPRRVLLKTQTALRSEGNNRVLTLDLDAGSESAETLLQARASDSGTGQGIVYGGVLCTPGCGDKCLVADADRGVLERFRITDAGLVRAEPLAVRGSVGLPPRDVGGL